MIQVGDYILYPAFFVLCFGIFMAINIGIVVFIKVKENGGLKTNSKSLYKYFVITKWQKKNIPVYLKEYRSKFELTDDEDKCCDLFLEYLDESKYWNVDELNELRPNLAKKISIIMYFMIKEAYLNKEKDKAILLIHAFDFINGGMEQESYGKVYEWISEDVDMYRNHKEMSDEEARLLFLYISAVSDTMGFIDPDLEKIPEDVAVEDFCKRIKQSEYEDTMEALGLTVDVRNLKGPEVDVIVKSLLNNLYLMLSGIAEEDEIEYVDELRRYPIRALAAILDGGLYSDIIDSIEYN